MTKLGFSCVFFLWSDEGGESSEDVSGGEVDAQEAQPRSEDGGLKDRLLRKFGSHISTLKLEFSKKKKKGKLPREARQTLLDWWNVHYKWPYPTVNSSLSFPSLPYQVTFIFFIYTLEQEYPRILNSGLLGFEYHVFFISTRYSMIPGYIHLYVLVRYFTCLIL